MLSRYCCIMVCWSILSLCYQCQVKRNETTGVRGQHTVASRTFSMARSAPASVSTSIYAEFAPGEMHLQHSALSTSRAEWASSQTATVQEERHSVCCGVTVLVTCVPVWRHDRPKNKLVFVFS